MTPPDSAMMDSEDVPNNSEDGILLEDPLPGTSGDRLESSSEIVEGEGGT